MNRITTVIAHTIGESNVMDIAALRTDRQRGQILVVAALAMIAMIGLVALVLEGGNAYAQQRVVQNGADASANAGTVVLAQRLGGTNRTDADVFTAVSAVATSNQITAFTGRYTNVQGQPIDSSGTPTSLANAVVVGSGTIPPNAQGVALGGTRSFDTMIGRAIGFNTFDASADATAVTGRLTGGAFLPVVFPVNITDCSQNGSTGTGESNWLLSQPGTPPVGQEYIVPLCKTGGGSFQMLDLDPSLRCDEEVATPPTIQWDAFPVDVPSDNGNNCAKPIADYVNANLIGETVLIPICDVNCQSGSGSNAVYHIIKVAAFYIDYMSDSNQQNQPNSACQGGGGKIALDGINGNGSSSCLVGWFVRYITSGPVGVGSIGNSDAIGIQLIR